jgi:hypothetical protein
MARTELEPGEEAAMGAVLVADDRNEAEMS